MSPPEGVPLPTDDSGFRASGRNGQQTALGLENVAEISPNSFRCWLMISIPVSSPIPDSRLLSPGVALEALLHQTTMGFASFTCGRRSAAQADVYPWQRQGPDRVLFCRRASLPFSRFISLKWSICITRCLKETRWMASVSANLYLRENTNCSRHFLPDHFRGTRPSYEPS